MTSACRIAKHEPVRSPPTAAGALAALSDTDEPATAGARAGAFILGSSSLVVRAACLLLDLIPWPSVFVRVAAESVAAIYLLDLVSGILHACFDYCDPGERLRTVVPTSKESVHLTRARDTRFLASGPWQQFVWNFQAHHAAPYPEHDDQLQETGLLVAPLLAVTAVQYAAGWLSASQCRVWTVLLGLGLFVQSSHFLAHRRNHLGAHSLPPLVARLQDARLLLHPDTHRRHHETFDCTFCIINGWANPLLNRAFRLASRLGVVDHTVVLQVAPARGG